MKKLFLTSGVILCMACPALADPLDITTATNDQDQYLLTDNSVANCSTPKTLTSDDSATTFYAKWTRHQYHVLYNSQVSGEGISSPVTGAGVTGVVKDDIDFGMPYTIRNNANDAIFARKGYTFTGWLSDYNLASGASTPVYASGNTPANPTSYTVQWLATAGNNPVTFGVTSANGDTDTVNLYATWTPNKYNVVYNYNVHAKAGSSDLANYTDPNGMTFDAAYQALSYTASPINAHMVVADGYTFRGWSTSASSQYVAPEGQQTEAQANPWMWTGDTLDNTVTQDTLTSYATNGYNVYAIYSANGYHLTYNCGQFNSNRIATVVAGHGLTSAVQTFDRTYDAAADALVDPRAACALGGYHVTGGTTWSCVKTGTNETVDLADIAGTWKVASDVTCTASWTANTIGLAWDAGTGATAQNGGTYSAGTGTDTCTYDLGINVGAEPKKAGYDFQGWTTSTTVPQGAGYEVFPSETAPTPGTTVNSEPATPANNNG